MRDSSELLNLKQTIGRHFQFQDVAAFVCPCGRGLQVAIDSIYIALSKDVLQSSDFIKYSSQEVCCGFQHLFLCLLSGGLQQGDGRMLGQPHCPRLECSLLPGAFLCHGFR